MSIAKNARASRVMSNVSNGTYVRGSKFANLARLQKIVSTIIPCWHKRQTKNEQNELPKARFVLDRKD